MRSFFFVTVSILLSTHVFSQRYVLNRWLTLIPSDATGGFEENDSAFNLKTIRGTCRNVLTPVLSRVGETTFLSTQVLPFKVNETTTLQLKIVYDHLQKKGGEPLAGGDHYVQALSVSAQADVFNVPITMQVYHLSTDNRYMRSFTDITVVINHERFLAQQKKALLEAGLQQIRDKYAHDLFLKADVNTEETLKELNDPSIIQRFIDAKRIRMEMKGAAEFLTDVKPMGSVRGLSHSVQSQTFIELSNALLKRKEELTESEKMIEVYEQLQHRAEALKKADEAVRHLLQQAEKEYASAVSKYTGAVHAIRSSADLKKFSKQNQVPGKLPLADRLGSLQTLSFGRSFVDYSDLTVRNMPVKGVNIEGGAGWYYALAAGRPDQNFRPYVGNVSENKSSLLLLRAGYKYEAGDHFIVSYLKGNSYLLNTPQHFSSVSAEIKKRLSNATALTIEAAKSFDRGSITSPEKTNAWKQRDNEAYAVTLETEIAETSTSFTGRYIKTGKAFRSFNRYDQNSSSLETWNISFRQKLMRRFYLNASVFTNQADFVSFPVISSTHNLSVNVNANYSNSRGTSIYAGYQPAAQYSKINDVIYRNDFQSLNVSVSQQFGKRMKHLFSTICLSRFFNDTGNSRVKSYTDNFSVSNYISTRSVVFNNQFQYSSYPLFSLIEADAGISVSVQNRLRLNGKVALYHSLQDGVSKAGYTAGGSLQLGRVGKIECNYQLSFISNYYTRLDAMRIGRIVYTKNINL